jgi:hypothetical protein
LPLHSKRLGLVFFVSNPQFNNALESLDHLQSYVYEYWDRRTMALSRDF